MDVDEGQDVDVGFGVGVGVEFDDPPLAQALRLNAMTSSSETDNTTRLITILLPLNSLGTHPYSL